jgi:hypothetical protein
MTYYAEPTNFAWVITTDHLYKAHETLYKEINIADDSGKVGPSEAPDSLTEFLTQGMDSDKSVKTYTFRMYDDDGILYYTGKLATYADKPSDDALLAPLADFGKPNAGAVLIKYHGHSEWTMEY